MVKIKALMWMSRLIKRTNYKGKKRIAVLINKPT
jgi:hypothetical protein